MELIRFYCNPIVRPQVQLSSAEAHHLSSVRRLKAGEKIELFDGQGGLAVAVIKTATKRKAVLDIEELRVSPYPYKQKIVIAASIAKGQRFDWLIEKCSELGVDRIIPVLFERTVKQAQNPKILDRWKNIAISAAKQSRRLFIPEIDCPVVLSAAMEILKNNFPKGKFLFGSLDADSASIISECAGIADVAAIIGPEGGLTESEQKLLLDCDCKGVRLTDTVLRVETAGVSFAAILASQRNAVENK